MAGINDIRNMFETVTGKKCHAVRMRYERTENGDEQVFEFDVATAKSGITTVEHRIKPDQWNPKDGIEALCRAVVTSAAADDRPTPVTPKPQKTPKPVEPPKPTMPNIGPQGLMMAPDTSEQRRIDEAFAGENRIFGAAEVPQTPFSSQASDTKTDEGTSQ